jgi:hypothetical protein
MQRVEERPERPNGIGLRARPELFLDLDVDSWKAAENVGGELFWVLDPESLLDRLQLSSGTLAFCHRERPEVAVEVSAENLLRAIGFASPSQDRLEHGRVRDSCVVD